MVRYHQKEGTGFIPFNFFLSYWSRAQGSRRHMLFIACTYGLAKTGEDEFGCEFGQVGGCAALETGEGGLPKQCATCLCLEWDLTT